jgi:hypothetical protein
VFGSPVGTNEGLKSGAIRGFRLNALTLCVQLLGENVRDQILLGGEVGIEGAIRQAVVGHHRGQSRAVDAGLLEAPPGAFEGSVVASPACGPCCSAWLSPFLTAAECDELPRII